ncbi:MAG: polysaccharide deacetylase family protein [Burkholderiales bacterium]|jgi:peptidoglycan/xylan/chitin deacetylase (PgdA/CDA1 family)|nr:polysaccharide deacetylase family protein [Burkholderiales bacterium]
MQTNSETTPSCLPVSPLGRLKIAITIDDMLLLRGVPLAPGHSVPSNVSAIVAALHSHRVTGVYQFSNTAPAEDDPGLMKIFDTWVENGHHVANHTHHHPPLNWVDTDTYARDIEEAEKYLGRYINAAPKRCFRFCMDLWGDTPCKCTAILERLEAMDYTPIPVSIGFHDIRWNAAYCRVLRRGSPDEAAQLRQAYVDSALRELRIHAANARAVFGRDPVHIWLIHGTSIAADCLEEILHRFDEAGVEFVPLDTAMADPMNAEIPPRVSPEFIFQVEKWALVHGVPVNDRHPAILDQIETLHPAPGEMQAEITLRMREHIASATGACVQPIPLSPDQKH